MEPKERRCGNEDCGRVIRGDEGYVLMKEMRSKDSFLVQFDVVYCLDCARVELEIIPPYTGPNNLDC